MLPMTTPNPQQPATRQWKMQFTSTPRCVRLARSQVGKTLRKWGYRDEDIDRMVHGRGLRLVAAPAKETGHRPRDPIGKTVWARLALTWGEEAGQS